MVSFGGEFAVKVKREGIETPISDFALSVYYSIRLNFEKALKYAKDDPYTLRFLYEIKGENEKAYGRAYKPNAEIKKGAFRPPHCLFLPYALELNPP